MTLIEVNPSVLSLRKSPLPVSFRLQPHTHNKSLVLALMRSKACASKGSIEVGCAADILVGVYAMIAVRLVQNAGTFPCSRCQSHTSHRENCRTSHFGCGNHRWLSARSAGTEIVVRSMTFLAPSMTRRECSPAFDRDSRHSFLISFFPSIFALNGITIRRRHVPSSDALTLGRWLV